MALTNRKASISVAWTCAAVGLVFLLKLVVLVQLRDHPLTQPDAGLDTTAYVELAKKVLDGDLGLGPGVYYVSPLYIYFLAAALGLLKSFTAVRVVQIALGTASVAFIFLAARAWFGRRAAWIGAGFAALTGLFTFYEVLILQASIDAFLTSAALYFLTRALVGEPSRKSDVFIAGLVFGIQTLNRPNVLIAAAGVALVMLIVTRRIRPAGLLIGGLLLGMSPAAIRNLVVAHQWSFVSSHGGLNFHIGNREGATGFYLPVPGITPTIVGQEVDARRVAAKALGRPVTDAEASDYFFGLSRTWIAEHPADALALFARKFYFTFNAAHVALPHSFPFYAYDAHTALRFYAVGPWLLIPLGLAGLTLGMASAAAPRRSAYLIWVSFVPAYAGAVALFFVAERYRLPLFVPLCAGAGAAVDAAMRLVESRRWRALALGAAGVTVVALAANWRLGLDEGRWLEGLRNAQQLVILGRYDEADRWAARLDAARSAHPGSGSYGVGAQLLVLNHPARALPYLESAHRADPTDGKIDYALGQCLLRMGRAAEAVPHLRHGFDAGIELPQGGYDFAAALHATGDFPAAASAIRRINPPASDDPESWLRLGRLAAQVRAPDVAEPFFRQAVQMRPDRADTHQQLGLNLLILEKFEEAARELGEAARLDPRDADSFSHLAYCELKIGRATDARAHALAALALNPDDQLAKGIIRAGGS